MADVILGNLPQASALTGAERVPMDQRVGGTLAATALTPGLGYAIISLGSTNWTACGVPAGVTPSVGLVFTCSAVGTGTGTAQQVETVDAAASEIAALAEGAISSAVAAHEAAANPHPNYTTQAEVEGIIAALTHLDVSITGAVTQHVRNDSGAPMAAGTPYHVVGAVGDTTRVRVVPSRADDAGTMPANGILQGSLTATGVNADGHGVVSGVVSGLNTSGGIEGATIWVGLTGGISTNRPASNPQPIGTLGRIHASTGTLSVAVGPVLSTVAFTGAYADLSGRPPEISQANAEAGSATVASLWTAQRWRQAAATWWETVTTAVGQSLVAAADGPAARAVIGAEASGAGAAAVTAHASSATPVHSASQISDLLSDSAPQNHAAIAAVGTGTSAARADHVHQFQPTDVVIPLSAPTGNLTVGEVENLAWPRTTILTAIPVWSVKTSPSGAVLQLDIRVSGTSIFSTLPTIDTTETSTTTAAVPAVFSAAFVSGGQTIAAGSLVTFHVTQIGSSTAGAGLKVALPTRRGS